MNGLSNRYAEIVAFEAAGRWKHAGTKTDIVRDRFDISMTRYFQILNHVLDLPAALRFDPTTVRRLTEHRDHVRRLRRTGMTS